MFSNTTILIPNPNFNKDNATNNGTTIKLFTESF